MPVVLHYLIGEDAHALANSRESEGHDCGKRFKVALRFEKDRSSNRAIHHVKGNAAQLVPGAPWHVGTPLPANRSQRLCPKKDPRPLSPYFATSM
jgi:hypothetical protein